jgi:hypothetical protein
MTLTRSLLHKIVLILYHTESIWIEMALVGNDSYDKIVSINALTAV